MATLLELAQIEENSRTLEDAGSPADPEVTLARELRARMRALLVKKAYAYIQATPNPDGQDAIEQLAFAQQVLRNPASHLDAVFHVALAQSPPAATVAQILGVTDAQLDAVLSPQTLRLLARGLRPGR